MMLLDEKNCYEAMKSHDARFDGRFFIGVTSTGIYCRPICTVKTPKPQNCRFFSSSALAEVNGFRPCLRCRPELAPGHSSFDAAHQISHSAVTLIEEGFLQDEGIPSLAKKLGVSDRHLRRVFHATFGVSIVEHLQTQRLLLAKRLLTDTALAVTDVAMASGFASLRRFNAAFKERYRLKPSDLRKGQHFVKAKHPSDPAFQFDLGFRPPYDQKAILSFLSDRAIAGVEQVEQGTYKRSVSITLAVSGREITHSGWIEVFFHDKRPILTVRISSSLSGAIPAVLVRVKRLFDLACEPTAIEATLHSLKSRPGLRVPGAFDGFEMSVRAILGQQISVKAARTLAGRIVAKYGGILPEAVAKVSHYFPSAQVIANCSKDDLGSLGITRSRVHSIIELAKAVDSKKVLLDPSADLIKTLASLKELPGIGEWTAQYIAMRALAWPDAFPHTDLGIKKALNITSNKDILSAAEAWKPWRAYAAMSLWQSLGPIN